jgi:regulator of replication initiation timing
MISFLFKYKNYTLGFLLLIGIISFYFTQKSKWENKIVTLQSSIITLNKQIKVMDANNTTIFTDLQKCKNDLLNLKFEQKWSRKISSVKQKKQVSSMGYIYSTPIVKNKEKIKENTPLKKVMESNDAITITIQ